VRWLGLWRRLRQGVPETLGQCLSLFPMRL
jgi:hypothetical protein